jgi:hypothetical protein
MIQEHGQEHQNSWDALKMTAESGCHTCRLFQLVKLHNNQPNSFFSVKDDLNQIRVARNHNTIHLNGGGIGSIRLAWSTLPGTCLFRTWLMTDIK